MTATYCTTAQVAQFLGIASFSSATTPTDSVVTELIERAEKFIEQKTQHAWKAVIVTNEFHNANYPYVYGYGTKFYLKHRAIRTFAAASGDKIEVFDGGTGTDGYTDWLATKTEGRKNDFWVDYEQGILYIFNSFLYREKAIRVTYRYGESTVPEDIEEAAILKTAIELISNDDHFALLKSAPNAMSLREKIEVWKEELAEILSDRREIQYLGN